MQAKNQTLPSSNPVGAGTGAGRRFTEQQREHALVLSASGVSATEVARVIGTTDKTIRTWVRTAEATGSMPEVPVVAKQPEAATAVDNQGDEAKRPGSAGKPTKTDSALQATSMAVAQQRSIYAPKDPGQGLGEPEVAAILELKREHPSYGPAQIRAQLKRFRGWRVANKAIARVLRGHGYDFVHRGSKPKGFEPSRFEAPRRNALWQLDYTDVRVGGEKLSLLVALDDFSRFVVGHRLCDSQDANTAVELLRCIIARHGKPEAVRTDRGGAFLAKEFTDALEADLIDHIVGRAYHPEGGGKVEAVIGTVKRELWEVEHFADRRVAERRLSDFFADYNGRRAHMGIDGLTPSDRFFGRADQVLAHINAISRRRNLARGLTAAPGGLIEENAAAHSGAPLEVLRLVVVDGHMELRLCGAAVSLGPVQG